MSWKKNSEIVALLSSKIGKNDKNTQIVEMARHPLSFKGMAQSLVRDNMGSLIYFWPFKNQLHKMVKHLTNCLSVFDHFVGLGLKGSKSIWVLA